MPNFPGAARAHLKTPLSDTNYQLASNQSGNQLEADSARFHRACACTSRDDLSSGELLVAHAYYFML
jgi:hypothetical protein